MACHGFIPGARQDLRGGMSFYGPYESIPPLKSARGARLVGTVLVTSPKPPIDWGRILGAFPWPWGRSDPHNSALPQVLVCIPCPILPKPHVGNEPTLRPDCGGPIREEAGSDGAPPDGGPSPLDPEHLCPSGMIGRLANKSGAPSSHGG